MSNHKTTPMMKQYWDAKNSIGKDFFLFFRLGDFYELFYEDAITGSKLLEIALTQRNEVPMCGVPAHTVDMYIKRLLKRGKKVAICEQTSPVQKGTIVERKVVEKITPGTIFNSIYLESKGYNFLSAVFCIHDSLVFAWMDVSTSDIWTESIPYSLEHMRMYIEKIRPKELLYAESQSDMLWLQQLTNEFSLHCTPRRDWDFTISEGEKLLRAVLRVETLKAYNLDDSSQELSVIHALLVYAKDSGKNVLNHITKVHVLHQHDYLELDADTLYNLEIYASMREQNRNYSLYGILDKTLTPMGARMLLNWIHFPLKDKKQILSRQKNIEYLCTNNFLYTELRTCLDAIVDIPRLMTRITLGKAHPRDLDSLRQTLSVSINLFSALERNLKDNTEHQDDIFLGISKVLMLIDKSKKILELLDIALVPNPPIQFGTEYVIAQGYDEKLDSLRNVYENQKNILDEYVAKEQSQLTFSLRLKYNNILGYFFELSHSYRNVCPSHFLLRQSLIKQDRYKTDELIALETKIFYAESELFTYEERLFDQLKDTLMQYAEDINAISDCISQVDVFVSFSTMAKEYNYVKPELTDDQTLTIIQGRHPVLERFLAQGEFIANDVVLDEKAQTFIMLTGPNMSGKSTYLRQTALIVLLAQLGSYVPAVFAKIGIRDKIFCRVGASDNIVKGESTFLAEMSETAYILQQATPKSLVIMDEIGRGTSVMDGMSIAQAVTEFFLSKSIFTLFATHYHNLTDLDFSNMKNYTLSIEQAHGTIVFTRHVKEGAVKNSYGIEVAKLAGVPEEVLIRAKHLLADYIQQQGQLHPGTNSNDPTVGHQLPLEFENEPSLPALNPELQECLDTITLLETNSTTPLSALNILVNLQHILHKTK